MIQDATTAAVTLTPELIASTAAAILVAVSHAANRFVGRKKDQRRNNEIGEHFAPLHARLETMEQQIADVKSDVREVRTFCVGPDGQNGFRKDIGEVKARVIGLEERERDRLAQERIHGGYDRRSER